MGFRQASGTKPTHLAAPVPGEAPMDPMALAAQVKAPPMAAMPSGSPSPIPSPAPDVADPFASIDVSDPFAELPHADEIPAEQSGPIDFMSKFKNEGVEDHVLGLKVRVGKDGVVEVKAPLGKSEWQAPTESQAEAARLVYSTIRDSGTVAGSVIGEVVGGIGGGIAAGVPTAGAGIVPGAVAGAAMGGAAGGALGSQLNQKVVDHLTSSEGGAKFLYLLKKMGGVPDDDEPTGALMSGLIGGVSPIGGALVGAAMRGGGKALINEAGTKAAQGIADTTLPAMGNLASDAATTGVDLSVADALQNLPGGGTAKQAINDVSSGGFGKDAKTIYETEVVKKQKQLMDYVNQVISKVAPGRDFANPSQLPFAKTARSGYGEVGALDGLVNKWGQRLGEHETEAANIAGGERFDISQFFDNAHAIFRQKAPAAAADALEAGNIEKASQIIKETRSTDTNLKGLLNAMAEIKQRVQLDNAQAIQKGIEGAGKGDIKQLTYDEFRNYLKGLQEFANSTQNPMLQQLSGSARAQQSDILEKVFVNDPERLQEIQAAKSIYHQKIDEVTKVADALKTNKANIGGAVLDFKPESVRALKFIVSNPEDLAQFRGAALDAAFRDQLTLNPMGVSSSKINEMFFSQNRSEAMKELLGEETLSQLKSVANIASVLEKQSIKPDAKEAMVDKAFTIGLAMQKMLGGVSKSMKMVKNFLSNDNEAQLLLDTRIADYQKLVSAKTPSERSVRMGNLLNESSKKADTATKRILQTSNLSYETFKGSDEK
jgi:hypothetical protein